MMPKFVRAAGLRIRRYVLPLVGYWDLAAQLGELRARLGEIEVGLAGRLGEIEVGLGGLGGRLGELEVGLAGRLGEIEVGLGGRLGEIVALTAARLGEFETLSAMRLTTTEKRLMEVVSTEVERLDGYLVHHIMTLRADIRSRPRVYAAQGLGSLMLAEGFDLLVPTREVGVLAFLLRSGLNAVEPGVRAVLRNRLRPGDVAVDGGANIGLHSLTMAAAVGATGRLVCFEPLPHLADALTWTLRLNGLGERATVQRAALSDTVGEAALHVAPHSPISSLFALPESAGANPLSVPTVTLDSYLPPGSRLDLVKLDIEGAEPSAWRGMRRVREENPMLDIVLEWSASHFARTDESPVEFFRAIRADGFFVFVIEDAPEPDRLLPLDDEQAATTLEGANLLLTRRPADGAQTGTSTASD
jgi:FkbM family methyltransferase